MHDILLGLCICNADYFLRPWLWTHCNTHNAIQNHDLYCILHVIRYYNGGNFLCWCRWYILHNYTPLLLWCFWMTSWYGTQLWEVPKGQKYTNAVKSSTLTFGYCLVEKQLICKLPIILVLMGHVTTCITYTVWRGLGLTTNCIIIINPCLQDYSSCVCVCVRFDFSI